MAKYLTVAAIILNIFAIRDVLRKLRADVPRFLWIVCILFLPFFGAGLWYYVQYGAPRRKQLERERKRR